MVKRQVTSQAGLFRFQQMARRLRLVRGTTTVMEVIQATSAYMIGNSALLLMTLPSNGPNEEMISMVKRVATTQASLFRFQPTAKHLRLVQPATTAMAVSLVMFASIRGPALHGASLEQILMVKRLATIQAILSRFQRMVRRLRLVLSITTAMGVTLVVFASIRGTAHHGARSWSILMGKRQVTVQAILSRSQRMVRRLQLARSITTAMVMDPVMFASIRGPAHHGSGRI